ncbi:hypothetical protein L0Y98_18195 [Burkholderia multivorans]|uniref:hypothetical protein n=1 Tax=Burkholderia multivorans TaxID=87883 RepID=UPI002018D210|nr:hypothetical protein [Burkholderia multivorans]MDN8032391.1 hypothetical protein [Burkholderia multivorans]UQP21398.1 hypothetical protein L0Y98_18195 [Burkholderia multivorans]
MSRMVTPYAQTARRGNARHRLYHAGYAQHVERDVDQIAVGDTIEDSIADNVIGDQRIPSVGVALDLDDELLRIRGKRQEPVPADEYATV